MTLPEATIPVHSWAAERLPSDVTRAFERLGRADDVRHIAIMPDVHASGEICVGTVFATQQLIYPDAIGGDIGCGMAAVAFDSFDSRVRPQRAMELIRALRDAVPIQRQRAAAAEALFAQMPPASELSMQSLCALAQGEGAFQLGTLGRGNHFLELQRDQDERLWLMVHSGSRGMGQAIRAAHMHNAIRGEGGFAHLDAAQPAGAAYLNDMHWARRFAAASRRAMLMSTGRAAAELFGWSLVESSLFDCDHNHINQESHFGSTYWVHRKGAVAAHEDQRAIVPGSMAAPSYHVAGRGVPESLCSSAHGAGRAMSRTEARSRISRECLARDLRDVFVDPRAMGGLREEGPSAYKDIRAVMKAQRDLVRVHRTLQPILTHKGGSK